MPQPLEPLAQEVAALLHQAGRKVVFAESCTAGLISATLGRVPGVSAVHCGSAVVYRLATKTEWLAVPADVLDEFGAVNEPVATMMAEGVLARTSESDIAVSITGHLGPNAPSEQDGLIYVGIAVRGNSCRILRHRLEKFPETGLRGFPGETEREQRQWIAVEFALMHLAQTLQELISLQSL